MATINKQAGNTATDKSTDSHPEQGKGATAL
jgi:hypothetical protein